MMKKALFIISLKYPLFNAINIKMNELKDKHADLILDNNHEEFFEIADRIRKTGIFENVYVVNVAGHSGLKKYFKRESGNNFIESLVGSLKNLELKIYNKINKDYFLEKSVLCGGKIDLTEYDSVYICSETSISWYCLDTLAKNASIQKINLIEEGARDYCDPSVILQYSQRYPSKDIMVNLYDSSFVGYSVIVDNVHFSSIKKIEKSNIVLKNYINYIFGYKDDSEHTYNNRVIFFEQVAEPMPRYLLNAGFFKRFILKNAFKKHMKEHFYFTEKCKVVDSIIGLVEKHIIENLFIKLHPRTKFGVSDKWKPYIENKFDNNQSIPWEVYCLNANFKNNIWITISSSAVFSSLLCFNEENNIKYFLLYKCSDFYDTATPMTDKFYRTVQEKYKDDIFIPSSVDEFLNDIDKCVKCSIDYR